MEPVTPERNARAIAAQRRSNYILYVLVLVAVALVTLLLTNRLDSTRALTHQNQTLIRRVEADTRFLDAQRVATAQQRKATTALVCHTTNELVRSLRGLIVSGARGSIIFEKLFQQFHAPPYAQRLRIAARQARSLAPLDCAALTPKVVR